MVGKFKKGDRVTVLSGKDKGKTGEVLKVLPSKIRAVVQGINLYKRHTPPSQAGPGGIVEKEASIHLSNLSHLEPSKRMKIMLCFIFSPSFYFLLTFFSLK